MKSIFISFLVLLSFSLQAQERALKVEPNHSTVGFSITISGFTKVIGKFNDFEILMDWNDSDFSKSAISSTIQTASIDTGIPDRDVHLCSEDFFDTEKFPTLTFESDSIQTVDFSHFNAYGKFTMHGVTKSVVLPFQVVKVDGNTIGIQSLTTINRLDYGVGGGFEHDSMDDFLSKEVEVQIYFWTKKRMVVAE